MQPKVALWHGYKAKRFGCQETARLSTKSLFDRAELFIITLGLSKVWYDEVTAEVFWREPPREVFDASRHKFRLSRSDETRCNLGEIWALIREFRPDAKVVLTISPIPLTATFRDVGCISANAVSKAILRKAVDEFYETAEGRAPAPSTSHAKKWSCTVSTTKVRRTAGMSTVTCLTAT